MGLVDIGKSWHALLDALWAHTYRRFVRIDRTKILLSSASKQYFTIFSGVHFGFQIGWSGYTVLAYLTAKPYQLRRAVLPASSIYHLRNFIITIIPQHTLFNMVYNWDGKEAECYRLYVAEKKNLEEVMDYWEQRGFTPR
jgi:hypothetical protein